MYKVFLNEKKITITPPGNITLNKPIHFFDSSCTIIDVKNWFLSFIANDIQEINLIHSNPEEFFNFLFQPAFKTIHAAGGIVKRKNRLLFIYRFNKWDLPKGKINKGESAKKAALREVKEECGIYGHKITKQLPSTFHIYKSPYNDTKDQWIFKETFWFKMKYSDKKKWNTTIK